jgi:hypothetical protein
VKGQLARCARSINESVADRPKADTAISQFLNELDHVVHRATESIELPNHKRVALLQLGKASFQLSAVRCCSGDLLGEDVVSIDAEASQRIDLKCQVLVVSANARIANQGTVENKRDH